MKTATLCLLRIAACILPLAICHSAAPAESKAAGELAWKFEYEDGGRLTKTTDPAGRALQLQYAFDPDKRLRKLVQTCDDGSSVTVELDESDRKPPLAAGARTVAPALSTQTTNSPLVTSSLSEPSGPQETTLASQSQSPPTNTPPGPPSNLSPPHQYPDLFGQLRAASSQPRILEPDWERLAAELQRLQRLDGASLDPATGQIVLIGESANKTGPFLLEDLLVALRAAFFSLESPGMTIDENPDDKRGPTMHVRYFGGTSNTHLGRVMFEVDRLMKCFGQGVDNITKQPLRPRFEGFYTQAELSQALGDAQGPSNWSRFWANLATGRFATNDLRGKVVLEQSLDGRTVYLLEHRIWIDTEQMYDPGRGHRLVSSGGVKSPSAEKFADQLTATFDEISKEFPVFGELRELSKLVVLAEWLRESGFPFDPELLHYQIDSRTTTSATTPSLSTTNSWTNGSSIAIINMFGGVSLDAQPRYGTPKDSTKKKADPLAKAVEQRRAELRTGDPVQTRGPDGAQQVFIPAGPPIRGPPSASGIRSEVREPVRVMEVQGRIHPVSRELEDPVLGKCELPVRTDVVTGRDMTDMPILRVYTSPRHERTVTFTSGSGTKTEVKIPDQLYLTSPSREISIRFQTEPQFDVQRNAAYFPSSATGVKGYYPKDRTVRMNNGTEFQFDLAGLPVGVQGPDMPTLTISHPAYQDGPCIQTPATRATMPRAPPGEPVRIMETRRHNPVVSRELDAAEPSAEIRSEFRKADSDNGNDGRNQQGASLTFSVANLVNLRSLAGKLDRSTDAVSAHIRSLLSVETKEALAKFQGATSDASVLHARLAADLNRIIRGQSLYDEERFAGVVLRSETQKLLAQKPRGDALARLHRLLLEDAYPLEISKGQLNVPGQSALTRTVIRNTETHKSMEVRDDKGSLFYVGK